MSAKVKNIEDLNKLNVDALKEFLRARGQPTTKGLKQDLLRLARLYFRFENTYSQH